MYCDGRDESRFDLYFKDIVLNALADITASRVIPAYLDLARRGLNNNPGDRTRTDFTSELVFENPHHYLDLTVLEQLIHNRFTTESELIEALEVVPALKRFVCIQWVTSAMKHSRRFREMITDRR